MFDGGKRLQQPYQTSSVHLGVEMATATYSPVDMPEIHFTDTNIDYQVEPVQKSFHSIDIHEARHEAVSPEYTLRTKNSWSQSSDLTASKEQTEKSLRSRTSSFKHPQISKTGSWLFEIVSLLVSIAAVAGIVGVLAHFDGRSLPDWPLNITINTLIALLATLANANLAIPLQSGIGQFKWIHFKAGRAPLTDIEAYDDASRGTWGAIKLLAKMRGG